MVFEAVAITEVMIVQQHDVGKSKDCFSHAYYITIRYSAGKHRNMQHYCAVLFSLSTQFYYKR